MQPDVLICIFSHAILVAVVVLWFLLKARPKFQSGIAVGFVVLFGLMLNYGVLLILEFAVALITDNPESITISIGYGLEISLIEETIKLIAVALAVLVARGMPVQLTQSSH
jgi:RsiW-degrading membrane proteinase PrsW (M82 family)